MLWNITNLMKNTFHSNANFCELRWGTFTHSRTTSPPLPSCSIPSPSHFLHVANIINSSVIELYTHTHTQVWKNSLLLCRITRVCSGDKDYKKKNKCRRVLTWALSFLNICLCCLLLFVYVIVYVTEWASVWIARYTAETLSNKRSSPYKRHHVYMRVWKQTHYTYWFAERVSQNYF